MTDGCGSKLQPFGVAHGVPEVEDINRTRVFVDGIDDPILCATTDTKQIGAVRSASKSEVTPGQWGFSEIDRKDAIEPLDLFNGDVFAVVAKIGGEFVDFTQCDWIDAHAEWHRVLSLAGAVDAQEAVLEGLGVVVDALAGLDARLGLFQGLQQPFALLRR